MRVNKLQKAGCASFLIKKDIFLFFAVLLLTCSCFLFMGRNFFGNTYTGWDTHDLGFTAFLYFNDVIQGGQIPYWNPLIQGGSFHATLFNVGNYSLFQGFFLGFAQFFNPIYVYEWMIQVVIVIGLFGFYFWIRTLGASNLVSIFGVHAFFLSVLMPLVGQVMFLFSLSSLPWMLFLCQRALIGKYRDSYCFFILSGFLVGIFMVSGYPWMNVINFIICTAYILSSCFKEKFIFEFPGKQESFKLMAFLLSLFVVMVCYYTPGLYSLNFYYSDFFGDYVSPEPRLRNISPDSNFSFRNLFDATFVSIDPRILKNNTASMEYLPVWTWGSGLVIWLLLALKKRDVTLLFKSGFWFAMASFWLLYSAGALNKIVEYIPLLKSNRWWFIGLVYVSVSLITALSKIIDAELKETGSTRNALRFICISTIVFVTFAYYESPIYIYVFVLLISLVIFFLYEAKGEAPKKASICLLMIISSISFYSMQHTMPGASRSQVKIRNESAEYVQRIESRNRFEVINSNERQLGNSHDYIFNNENWLIAKTPFSHGYNPLGNPIYWYFKDNFKLREMIYVTNRVRVEAPLNRESFSRDNEYVEALVKDVMSNQDVPTVNNGEYHAISENGFRSKIIDLKISSDLVYAQVEVNGPSYVVLNNTFFPGWEVFVDGKRKSLAKINHVFQGVYLDTKGTFKISFRFRPGFIKILIMLPTFLLLVVFIAVLIKSRLRKLHEKLFLN